MTLAELLHVAKVNQRVLCARLAVMEAQADFDLLMIDYGTGGGAGLRLREHTPDWLTRRDILRGAIFGNGEEIALLKSLLATQAPTAPADPPEPEKEGTS